MNYVGIDIGGTNIKAGLLDESGAIRDSRRTTTITDDLDGLLRTLTSLIAKFQSSVSIDAVGIGIPGLRSKKTHRIEMSPNIPCIHNLDLEALLSKQLNLPVVVENDANAGAYGEWVAGAGKGKDYMAYLTIGTGLGCGLVLSGDLYRGAAGYAGELGHVHIEPNGRAANIYDRVERADLVKVDLFHRLVMHAAFGFRQSRKDQSRAVLNALAQLRFINDLEDVTKMSMRVLVGRLHLGIGRTDAGAVNFLEIDFPTGEAEQMQLIAQCL